MTVLRQEKLLLTRPDGDCCTWLGRFIGLNLPRFPSKKACHEANGGPLAGSACHGAGGVAADASARPISGRRRTCPTTIRAGDRPVLGSASRPRRFPYDALAAVRNDPADGAAGPSRAGCAHRQCALRT